MHGRRRGERSAEAAVIERGPREKNKRRGLCRFADFESLLPIRYDLDDNAPVTTGRASGSPRARRDAGPAIAPIWQPGACLYQYHRECPAQIATLEGLAELAQGTHCRTESSNMLRCAAARRARHDSGCGALTVTGTMAVPGTEGSEVSLGGAFVPKVNDPQEWISQPIKNVYHTCVQL